MAGHHTADQPSLHEWRGLTLALDAVTEPEALDAALSRTEQHCAHWPDGLRLVPGRWLRDLMDGREQPRVRVARALDVTLHDMDIPGDRRVWADAPALGHLRSLRVLDARLGDDGLARWLDSAGHAHLTDLALGSGISDVGARRLAADPRLASLESLALFRNALGPAGLSALLASPHLGANIKRLLLGRNALVGRDVEGVDAAGVDAAAALATPTSMSHLELLDLDCNRLEPAAIQALSLAPILEGVRLLNLSNNPIGRGGCEALAASPRLRRIDVILLHGCGLSDDDVAPLLEAPWLAQLSNLALSQNKLSLDSVRALALRSDLQLGELDICHNRFAEAEAEAIIRAASQFSALRRLCT